MTDKSTELLQSISEVNDFLDGDKSKVVTETVSFKEPPTFNASAIKQIRSRIDVTQRVMAKILAVSPRTVEAWEAGRTEPNGSSRRLLQIITKHPHVVDYLKS